jgi:hypothetical protein
LEGDCGCEVPFSGQVTTDLAVSGIELASASAIADLAGNAANLQGRALISDYRSKIDERGRAKRRRFYHRWQACALEAWIYGPKSCKC